MKTPISIKTLLSIIGLMFILLFYYGGIFMFSQEIHKDQIEKQRKEQLRFERDSLQVEMLKKELNAK